MTNYMIIPSVFVCVCVCVCVFVCVCVCYVHILTEEWPIISILYRIHSTGCVTTIMQFSVWFFVY